MNWNIFFEWWYQRRFNSMWKNKIKYLYFVDSDKIQFDDFSYL